MLADLHMHSTASDGALSPSVLMACAAQAGIELVALTDHDTVTGLEEARLAALNHGMQWISGIELSAQWQGHTIHVLGYGFDPADKKFNQALAEVRDGRWQRAREIAAKLADKRMPGGLEGALAVQQAVGSDLDSPPARPHFADWMVKAGHVRDRAEAFRRWLGAGRLGDIKQHWPMLEVVVEQLRAAGGMAVLAHPWDYGFTRARIRRLLRDFATAGGRGMEVVNGRQAPDKVAILAQMSVEFGYLASCGSDFHHPDTPWRALGKMTALPAQCNPVWTDARFAAAQQ